MQRKPKKHFQANWICLFIFPRIFTRSCRQMTQLYGKLNYKFDYMSTNPATYLIVLNQLNILPGIEVYRLWTLHRSNFTEIVVIRFWIKRRFSRHVCTLFKMAGKNRELIYLLVCMIRDSEFKTKVPSVVNFIYTKFDYK